MKIKKYLLSLLISIVLILNTAAPIWGQYFTTISPPTTYLTLTPGETHTHTITVTNNTPFSQIQSITAVDFKSDGETGIPVLQESLTFPFIQNKREALQDLVLAPNQTKKVTIEIAIPTNTSTREYPISFLFSQKNHTSSDIHTDAQVTGTIASNLIITVQDNKDITATIPRITSLSMKKFVDSFESVHLTTIIAQNDEPIKAQAKGFIIITSPLGKEVGRFPIYPDTILASSTRIIRNGDLEKDTLPMDDFVLDQNFLLGKYSITHVSPKNEVLTTIDHFYALPFKLLLILLLAGLFFAYSKLYLKNKNLVK